MQQKQNIKIGIIVQARMTSSRLPGKVLLKVGEKTLLAHQIEKLLKVKRANQLIIATTVNSTDDPIVNELIKYPVKVFRGDELNVLSRYYLAAKEHALDVVIRVTSDCPLIDPAIIDFAIESFCTAKPPLDYLSNTVERTYPRGLDVEVFSVAALNRSYVLATKAEDLEHVTRYIYTHPEDFKISQFKNKIDHSEHRWTVDTKEDFELAQKMLTALSFSESSGSLEDCLKLLEQHPEWALINSHIKQKA